MSAKCVVRLCIEHFDQRLRLFEVEGAEAFGDPTMDRGKKLMGSESLFNHGREVQDIDALSHLGAQSATRTDPKRTIVILG